MLRSLSGKLPSNFPAALLAIYAAETQDERLKIISFMTRCFPPLDPPAIGCWTS